MMTNSRLLYALSLPKTQPLDTNIYRTRTIFSIESLNLAILYYLLPTMQVIPVLNMKQFFPRYSVQVTALWKKVNVCVF